VNETGGRVDRWTGGPGKQTARPGTLVAITREPSARMEAGERTYIDDQAIDGALALAQHQQYQAALRRCGARIVPLPGSRDLPDCVFVEDTAIVVDEIAVLMSMGAASRRDEVPVVEAALREFRTVAHVQLPAKIDGGDVVRSGRDVFVGLSQRTNAAGVDALRGILAPFGYTVTGVPVLRCLHLKSACSALPDGRLLVNAHLIGGSSLTGRDLVEVPKGEPLAGDVLVIGEHIIVSDAFPETSALLSSLGWEVVPVSVSEFAKAEGGVTCLSLVFNAGLD
jgi:dimethylargininase